MMINAISWHYSADYPLEDGESLPSSMMRTFEERHDILEAELRAENDSMQARNDLLKDLNGALAALRANRPNDEKTAKYYGAFTTSHGQWIDVYEWMQKNGIPVETINNDHIGLQSEFDAAINNVKAGIDSANSEGQMAMIHFQDVFDKSNRVAELTSNLLSKDQKTSELIIGNIR